MTDWREKLDKEIAAGRLWRAKEIAQGRLSHQAYDLELFEKYGSILKEMGDLRSAGKFLFLSGIRRPDYSECIELFLEKDGNGAFSNFWGKMPNAARLASKTTVPKIVIDELITLGFAENAINKVFNDTADRLKRIEKIKLGEGSSRFSNWFSIATVMALAALFIGLVYQAIIGVLAIWTLLLG